MNLELNAKARKAKKSKLLAGLIIGGAIGSVLGAVFGPKKETKWQNKLQQGFNCAVKQVTKLQKNKFK